MPKSTDKRIRINTDKIILAKSKPLAIVTAQCFMCCLPLINSNQVAVVDREDFELLSEFRWRLGLGDGIYASLKVFGMPRYLWLPRVIMNAPESLQVDHKNHNRLDNRKSNLRLATASQNTANRRKWGNGKFRGVRWKKRDQQWEAYILSGKNRIYLGYFQNELAAANQYNRFARLLWGEFAFLNVV